MIRKILDKLNKTGVVHCAVVCSVLIFGFWLRYKSFQGYADSDPRTYSILANDLAAGQWHIPGYEGAPVCPLRLGVYAPVAALIFLFGLSELHLVVYPFVLALAGLLLAYVFARLIFGPLAGILACFFASIVPIDLTMSSLLYPDLIAAFWGNLAVFIMWMSLWRKWSVATALWAFVAGVIFGFSWLCKETVAYLVPFCIILIFEGRFRLKRDHSFVLAGFVMAGALMILAGESIFYTILANDGLFHLHEMERNYLVCKEWFWGEDSPILGWKNGGFYTALYQRLFVDGPRHIIYDRNSFGLFPLMALVAIAYAVWGRIKEMILPSIWFLSLVLIFNFGSTSFHSYKPLPPFDRYLYPMILPSVILVSGFMSILADGSKDVVSKIQHERLFWFCLLSLLILGTIYPHLRERMWRISDYPARIAARYPGRNDLIFTDYRTVNSVAFFRSNSLVPDEKTRPYEQLGATEIPAGAYVLVDLHKTKFLESMYKYHRRPFEDAPPSNWRVVWSHAGATLYRVETP